MMDINKVRQERDRLAKLVRRQASALSKARLQTYQNYQDFVDKEQNTGDDNEMTKLEAELIGIGVSIIASCYSCMESHIKEAINSGATYDQLRKAVEIGIKEAGEDIIAAQYAMDILETYKDQ